MKEKSVKGRRLMVSRKEAAKMLGYKTETLARWKCNGNISLPCVKIGYTVRYRLADIKEFIMANMTR